MNQQMPPFDTLVDATFIARLLKISPKRVIQMANENKLPHYVVNNELRFSLSECDEVLTIKPKE